MEQEVGENLERLPRRGETKPAAVECNLQMTE